MLAKIFKDIVNRDPKKIAVKTPLIAYSYAHLDRFSDYLVHEIVRLGTRTERGRIALLFEHGADMITATVAAFKAGRAYIPLTPSYPDKRLREMIRLGDAGLLITNDESWHMAQRLCADLEDPPVLINAAHLERIEESAPQLPPSEPAREAYVLFTSGSTGTPKGVMQREESIIHYCRNYVQTFGITAQDRLTLFSTFGHDASIVDIYASLLAGATLYPLSVMTEWKLGHLADWLITNRISVWHSVPAFFRFFMNSLEGGETFPYLRHIVLGGETVYINDFNKARTLFPNTALANLYGQTESSYNSTFIVAPGAKVDKITLGEPIADLSLLVVNEEGEEVDPFQVGEIVVGTPYIASGYLGEDADNSCFAEDEDFGRLYWTGDLGRLLLDGQIEFMGRSDFRVKIRGNRIELGEVENAILSFPGVRAVIAGAFTDPSTGNQYLAAFLQAGPDFKQARLREHLRGLLPDTMIPSYFVNMEVLPRTATGKLDRKNLPDPQQHVQREMDYRAPSNDIEKRLAALWQEVLKIERIGIDDDFFELGGHSLRAMNMLSRIHQIFEVDIQLNDLFGRPTIREIALLIGNAQRRTGGHIERVEPRPFYPLSAAQKRLFILHNLDPISVNYNLFFPIRITGQIDLDRFKKALDGLIARHEILRTSFHLEGKVPVQKIHGQVSCPLVRMEVPMGELDAQIRRFNQPFDLGVPCQMRVALLQESPLRHLLLINIHHIITDGTSNLQLFKDFLALYADWSPGEPQLHYRDYAVWQSNRDLTIQEQYWKEIYREALPILELPTDRPRPAIQSFEGASLEFTMESRLTAQLKALARRSGATLYMTLLAGWYSLLHKYTGQEDMAVGSPIAGRPHNDLQHLVGMFVNTMALRAQPRAGMSFLSLLEQVKSLCLAAYQHQEYPFEALVEQVVTRRDFSRNPIFDTMFVLQNMERGELKLEDLDFSEYELQETTAKFDLTLIGEERPDALTFKLTYATRLFDEGTVRRMMDHFMHLLEQVSNQPDIKLEGLNLMSLEEQHQVLAAGQGPEIAQESTSLVAMFEQMAAKFGDRPALAAEGQVLTYDQLNRNANRLAHVLIAEGMAPTHRVSLVIERGVGMATAILAILKAGAAYHPVDPAYPAARRRFMLQDAQPQLILHEGQAGDLPATTRSLDLTHLDLRAFPEHNPETDLRTNHPAYLIYTSGTTGQPKGVLVSQGAAASSLCARNRNYALGPGHCALQLFSFAFDGFVTSFFSPLTSGGTVVLAGKQDMMEAARLGELLRHHQVTHLIAVPQLYKLMLDTLPDQALQSLRCITLAGDQIAPEILRCHRRRLPQAELAVEYGLTEAAVMSTIARHQQREEYPNIGTPVDRCRIYVTDPQLQLLPMGIAGEICIGGAGLADGYLGRPDLTAARFVPNPFAAGSLYRSGDRGRLLANGHIQFLGRMDQQVKIRGFRIEPSEIEHCLAAHGQVREAVVIDRKDEAGQAYLAAYVTAGAELDTQELILFLAEHLPEYMIPSFVIRLEQFPLTPNGKIDKQALPLPQPARREKLEPRTEQETQMRRIWAETLEQEASSLSIRDNFFDLGGHSLTAVRLVDRIHKECKVRVPLSLLFKQGTIEALAAHIARADAQHYASIKAAPPAESYPLSAAQQRLYVLHQIDPASTAYNMPLVVQIEGSVALFRFEQCLNQLAARHASLRTAFFQDGEHVRQRILPQAKIPLVFMEGSMKEAIAAAADFQQPFCLEEPPLLRACLFKVEEDHHLFMLDMHHIAGDGLSAQILLREFATLYHGGHLPSLKLHYVDYAHWQQEQAHGSRMAEQAAFWREQFADEIPRLEIPTDFMRPALRSFAGGAVRCHLNQQDLQRLKNFARERELTPYMVLMGTFALLLGRYAGQQDLVVGTPVSGRPHGDLQPMVGMFANTLPLRFKPERQLSVEAYFRQVRHTCVTAFEHQDYPFEALVEALDLPRDTSRNPLFDVMFSLLQSEKETQGFSDLVIKPFEREQKTAKFDLLLDAYEHHHGLDFHFQFATSLFARETIACMAAHWCHLLTEITENPQATLGSLTLVPGQKEAAAAVLRGPQPDYPADLDLASLFRRCVDRYAGQTALSHNQCRLSYSQLAQRVSDLAAQMAQQGIGAGDRVALHGPRSVEMIIAMLAVLQIGGAYVPLDPDYPADRTTYILQDCNAKLVLAYGARPEVSPCPVLDLAQPAAQAQADPRPCVIDPGSGAYVIYTSGSTGQPKGVMVRHNAVVNLAFAQRDHFAMDVQDRVLQFANICFDASVEQIWTSFVSGATLVLIDREKINNLPAFYRELEEQAITHLHAVPAFLEQLDPAACPSLKRVVAGGDICRPELAQRWFKQCAFYNEYGPTETTVTSVQALVRNLDPKRPVPIGKPLAHTDLYILDEEGRPTANGIAGELYIGGRGLAGGYLNRAPETAQRFIKNPFGEGRLYRTGDRVRCLANGELVFLGRVDHQIKLRGFRLELGEIEQRLLQLEGVREAIVLTKPEGKRPEYLAAYVAGPKQEELAGIKAALAQRLPAYMLPSRWRCLEALPKTSGGKTDRRALHRLPLSSQQEDQEAPLPGLEAELAQIWSELLAIPKEEMTRSTSFFELGGHSLKATRLAARLRRSHGVELPLAALFAQPSLAGLAALVAAGRKTDLEPIPKAPAGSEIPLSHAQERMLVMHQMQPDSTFYNMPSILEIKGHLDGERLAQAFNQVIENHEILRTIFLMEGGQAKQKVLPPFALHIEHTQLRESDLEQGLRQLVRPFRLDRLPLMRIQLAATDGGRQFLVVDQHHIIGDGVSQQLLVKEVAAHYAGKPLRRPELQFRDYAVHQRSQAGQAGRQELAQYWKARFSQPQPVLQLPTDRPKEAQRRFRGDRIYFTSPRAADMARYTHEHGVTPFMLMLACYHVLLAKLGGNDDITVGVPSAGRKHPDLSTMMGVFINTLPLRHCSAPAQSFASFLAQVKEETVAAFDHGEYPYDLILAEAGKTPAGANLFDHMLVLQESEATALQVQDLRLKPWHSNTLTAKCDLTLYVHPAPDAINFIFEYDSDLFDQETVTRFGGYLTDMLAAVLDDQGLLIRDIPIQHQFTEATTFEEDEGDFAF